MGLFYNLIDSYEAAFLYGWYLIVWEIDTI